LSIVPKSGTNFVFDLRDPEYDYGIEKFLAVQQGTSLCELIPNIVCSPATGHLSTEDADDCPVAGGEEAHVDVDKPTDVNLGIMDVATPAVLLAGQL
jgi:hypothetical protein